MVICSPSGCVVTPSSGDVVALTSSSDVVVPSSPDAVAALSEEAVVPSSLSDVVVLSSSPLSSPGCAVVPSFSGDLVFRNSLVGNVV